MKQSKQKKLNSMGWKVGSVQEFLKLSDEEVTLVEMKRALIAKIKEVRAINGITQHTLAKLLDSSQSRVAKMETGQAGVSLDLICRALLALGIKRAEIAKALAS